MPKTQVASGLRFMNNNVPGFVRLVTFVPTSLRPHFLSSLYHQIPIKGIKCPEIYM